MAEWLTPWLERSEALWNAPVKAFAHTRYNLTEEDMEGQPEIKKFYLTSEFWIIIAVNLGTILTLIADMVPPEWAALVIAIANAAYAISRGLAKSGLPMTLPAPPHVQVHVDTPLALKEELTERVKAEARRETIQTIRQERQEGRL